MKKLFLLPAIGLQTLLASAQSPTRISPLPDEQIQKHDLPKTELGLRLGLENFDKYQARYGSVDVSAGLYARRYFTTHWALEGTLNVSFTTGRRGLAYTDGHIPGWEANRSWSMSTYAVMQYHFGRAGQRLRPYVGAGTGLRFDRYNDSGLFPARYSATSLVLRAEAGLIYQVSNTVSVNASLHGFRDTDNIRSGLGFQLGVGIRLEK